MEFSKAELRLIAALAISPGRELSRARAAALFERPSEFERTLQGLRKHGVCTAAPVTGVVGLSVQMTARFLDLEGPVQEQPALNWQDDELNRAMRVVQDSAAGDAAIAREILAPRAEIAPVREKTRVLGDELPPEPRVYGAVRRCGWCQESRETREFCDNFICAPCEERLFRARDPARPERESREVVRTYVSTSRTSLDKERTNVLGALEGTLREPKWMRRSREEPEVMRRALASATEQLERGYRPRTPNGWFYKYHYKPAGGRLD